MTTMNGASTLADAGPLLTASVRPIDVCDIVAGAVAAGSPHVFLKASALPKFATIRKLLRNTENVGVAFDDAASVEAPVHATSVVPSTITRSQVGSLRAADNRARSDKSQLATAAKLKIFVIVLEEKGGVGKSVTSQTCNETLMMSCTNVLALDADFVNKNLSRSGLTKVEDALDVTRIDFEGFLFDAADKLVGGQVEAVVIDSGAGGERFFRPHLKELAQLLRKHGARLIVVRPITTSPLVHDNVVSFIREVMTPDMGMMLVRNMGQGRAAADYTEFNQSPEYAEMREAGLAECILESAGARYSDLATSFGRSFAQIARLEPNELGLSGRHLEIAKRVFTRPVRLFLARWLLRQTDTFRATMLASLVRTL